MEEVAANPHVESRKMKAKNLHLIPVLLSIMLVFPVIALAGQFKGTRVYDGDTFKAQ